MLRVGLTGGLGAGKSTAARMFADRGARVLSSDAIGRELMQPGKSVYAAIVNRFGPGVVQVDASLDRAELARLAFERGELEALNKIVHPAVIAKQDRLIEEIAATDPGAVVMVESALIFETQYGGPNGWRERFDRMVLVTAPDTVKVARFVERAGASAESRAGLEAEARRRLAAQMPDEAKIPLCDYVLANDGDVARLQEQVERVWQQLAAS